MPGVFLVRGLSHLIVLAFVLFAERELQNTTFCCGETGHA